MAIDFCLFIPFSCLLDCWAVIAILAFAVDVDEEKVKGVAEYHPAGAEPAQEERRVKMHLFESLLCKLCGGHPVHGHGHADDDAVEELAVAASFRGVGLAVRQALLQ